MNRSATLYKRDNKDNIICWQIKESGDNTLILQYGKLGHTYHVESIKNTLIKADEFKSRINAKRKEGYKALEDLYDNAPIDIDKPFDLKNYLNLYLPKHNTTAEGHTLCMLAKTLEDNKPFEKYGTMLGQWKINGLRCTIGAVKNVGDLFNPISLTYHSRTGENWTNKLKWFDEILLPKIDGYLLELMLEENAELDGEFYLPGYSVNDINSFVKNPLLPQHYKLQFWWYDIACENMTAVSRKNMREDSLAPINIFDKNAHLNNKEQVVSLPSKDILYIQDAITFRDYYIELGFEGLIVRNPNNEYAFGKRNSSMFKYKKIQDGLFTIVDIKEDKRGLPIYVLQNDINDSYFECTINLPQNVQKQHLAVKETLIDKRGLVEYRERSGVKQVPFHAKLIKIYI